MKRRRALARRDIGCRQISFVDDAEPQPLAQIAPGAVVYMQHHRGPAGVVQGVDRGGRVVVHWPNSKRALRHALSDLILAEPAPTDEPEEESDETQSETR